MLKIIKYLIMLLKDPKTYKWGTIGVFALICDLSLYKFLLNIVDMDLAKGAATFLGVNISFHFNRIWTFKSASSYFDDLKRYLALYIIAIIVNVAVNNFVFRILQDIDTAYFISLFVSVIIGYFGQRLWVFKNRAKEVR
jgi:putative flippase GtrA